MEAYTDFAALYDKFMEDTPYDKWCDTITDKLKKSGISDGLVCELGAGTGEMTRRLEDKGYDMIGIDSSPDMLSEAMKKKTADSSILYLCQDMREFELYGTVRAVVSVCDSINYILEYEDLLTVFKLVNNYLDPKGVFLFDFNTLYKYKEVIGDSTIAESRDDEAFIWENSFDEDSQINEYDITFFVRDGESDKFSRFTETHFQRGYELSKIRELIEASGLEYVEAYDADTGLKPTDKSERIAVMAKECMK